MNWMNFFLTVETPEASASEQNLLNLEFSTIEIVLGVLALLALCAALFWFIRKKRQPQRTENLHPAVIQQIRIGKVHGQGARSYQQDSFGVSDPEMLKGNGLLAVVADGMGGLSDGDKISTAVVETVLDGFTYSQGQGTPEQVLLTLTQWAVREVNRFLGPDHYRSSGSTMAMGMIRDGRFSWVSVGDSRICLYRGGQLIQLNREHDLKQKLALQAINGEISLQEVYTNKQKDGLVCFMGMGALDQVDLPSTPVTLIPGDQLIIMTDGIYNALEESEICAALDKGAEGAPAELEQAIQKKAYPDQDNYTAVILSCETQPASTGR